jgi:hypothetical protein
MILTMSAIVGRLPPGSGTQPRRSAVAPLCPVERLKWTDVDYIRGTADPPPQGHHTHPQLNSESEML